jgi:hypothetical protein
VTEKERLCIRVHEEKGNARNELMCRADNTCHFQTHTHITQIKSFKVRVQSTELFYEKREAVGGGFAGSHFVAKKKGNNLPLR